MNLLILSSEIYSFLFLRVSLLLAMLARADLVEFSFLGAAWLFLEWPQHLVFSCSSSNFVVIRALIFFVSLCKQFLLGRCIYLTIHATEFRFAGFARRGNHHALRFAVGCQLFRGWCHTQTLSLANKRQDHDIVSFDLFLEKIFLIHADYTLIIYELY